MMPNRELLRGVFTGEGPGLRLSNLGRLTEPIRTIDWHAPLDFNVLESSLLELLTAIGEHNLLLDAVVFGLPGESYADPATALETVGFAAPGSERRESRFRYAQAVIERVAKAIPREHFVRGRPTVKGHFGGFHELPIHELRHLTVAVGDLARGCLAQNDVLMLAETGNEAADDVIEFVSRHGYGHLGCNWDTANLQLWGAAIDNFEYGRALAQAGLLRGVHLKGGKPPAQSGQWGTEVAPTRELIAQTIAILQACSSFDGSLIVERELFLGDQRETQDEKAAGLSATLSLVRQALAA